MASGQDKTLAVLPDGMGAANRGCDNCIGSAPARRDRKSQWRWLRNAPAQPVPMDNEYFTMPHRPR